MEALQKLGGEASTAALTEALGLASGRQLSPRVAAARREGLIEQRGSTHRQVWGLVDAAKAGELCHTE